ncbi:hypothetical protein EON63_01860 [archaeon]|nr:MAG: hypothetical protein EON63_01860 [archaeon]
MQADSAHQHFLKREHFKTLMYILGEDGTFNVRIWELQYDDYYGMVAVVVWWICVSGYGNV